MFYINNYPKYNILLIYIVFINDTKHDVINKNINPKKIYV